VDIAEADERLDTLDDAKTRKEARGQSHACRKRLETSELEASSDRTLHGVERSRVLARNLGAGGDCTRPGALLVVNDATASPSARA